MSLFAALFTLFFAYAAKVLFLSITFTIANTYGSQRLKEAAHSTHWMGFLGEPNWGIYFIIFFPVTVWLFLKFILVASDALKALPLRKKSESPSIYAEKLNSLISDLNGRCRGFVAPVLFFIILASCITVQTKSLNGTKRYRSDNFWDIGQTQSPNLQKWAEFFNRISQNKRLRLLTHDFDDKSMCLDGDLSNRTLFVDLNKVITKDAGDSAAIDANLPLDKQGMNLSVAIFPSAANELPTENLFFKIFLVCEQCLVAASYVMLLLLLQKLFVFWFTLSLAIQHGSSMAIVPNCEDPTGHFGLSVLRSPLNCFWGLVFSIQIYVVLKLSNTTTANQLTVDHYAGAQLTLIINAVFLMLLPAFGYAWPKFFMEMKLRRSCPNRPLQSLVKLPAWWSTIPQTALLFILGWQVLAALWRIPTVKMSMSRWPPFFEQIPNFVEQHSDPGWSFGLGTTLCKKVGEAYVHRTLTSTPLAHETAP